MNDKFFFRSVPEQIPPERSLVAAEKKRISPGYFVAVILVYLSYATPLFGVWVLWTRSHLDWFGSHNDFCNAFYLLFFVLWVYVIPIRKRFGNGESRLMYNVLPVVIYLGLVFAQYHSFATYLLLSFWVMRSFFLWAGIPEKADVAIKQKLKTRFYRRSVSLLVVLFLIPSVIGVVHENRRASFQLLYQEIEDEYYLHKIKNAASKAEIYEEAKDVYLQVSPQQWGSSKPKERLEALRDLSMVECEVLGIPFNGLTMLCSADLPENCMGVFNHKKNTITISAALINATKPEPAVRTLLHELYHFYQWYMVQLFDSHETLADTQYFDQIRVWKANLEQYNLDGISFECYEAQPLEESARDFAEAEIKTVMRYANDFGT